MNKKGDFVKKVLNKPENGKKTETILRFLTDSPSTVEEVLRRWRPSAGRNSLKGLLIRGQVLVDGQAAKRLDQPLRAGQELALLPRGERPARAPLPVLYEDSWLVAVHKSAGLLAVPTDRGERRTALSLMDDYLRQKDSRLSALPVHRLDRDTSGILLFAKDRAVQARLRGEWDTLALLRGYQAVVEGAPRPEAGVIDRALDDRGKGKSLPSAVGRPARTRYRTLARGEEYALVELALETGRKNQIRAHLASLGCPVAGDGKYGAATDPLRRLCLHAHALTVLHPVTGQKLALTCPAPRAFSALVRGGTAKR